MEKLKYDISKNIKQLRSFYDISRRTLHKISGISEGALLRYENGQKAPLKYYLLIMSMMNISSFSKLFHLAKGNLTSKKVDEIEKVLNREISWRKQHIEIIRSKLFTINTYML